MNIVIRTDASIEIGTGHVMRCITLAKQLIRHGANITFICRKLEGNSIGYLKENKFKVIELPSIIKGPGENDIEWVRNHWEKDAKETRQALHLLNSKIHLLIIDHYGIDTRWETVLREEANRIMVIDDLADRPHDCDLLLDQNYYPNMKERYKHLVPIHCIQMLGPSYVLLRDEFLQVDIKQLERSGKINRVLVFFGGTDSTGETLKVLKAIQELNINDVEIDVIVGASNPRKTQIKQVINQMPNVSFYCQVKNMAEFMVNADFAIGAGGSTSWERCYLGLPSLTVVVAENQREIAKSLSQVNAIDYIGDAANINSETYKRKILSYLNNFEKVNEMSKNCLTIIERKTLSQNVGINEILKVIESSNV